MMNKRPDDFVFKDWFTAKIMPILVKGTNKIIEQEQQHSPLLLIFGYADGDVVPIVIPEFGDRESKDLITGLQMSVCRDTDNVAAVVFLSEVWRKSYDKPEDYHEDLELVAAADKEEGMMFNAMHGDEQLIVMFSIDREKKCLGEPEIHDPIAEPHTQGRMINK